MLSKVAAKASDPVLEEMSVAAPIFVELLAEDEPLLRAYTACIIANVAFLEIGQTRVLDAGGVPLIVRLLKQKDRKVQLHSSAAVQNLTYKNAACCAAVLQEGGEKALNKLLRHKSEDIQQFAAGALANLQLYRRGLEADLHGKAAKGSAGLALDQRTLASRINAATTIQAAVRGRFARIAFASRLFDHRQTQARKQFAQYGGHAQYGSHVQRQQPGAGGGGGAMGSNGFGRRQVDGGGMVSGNKYGNFNVNDVRTQLDVLPPSLPPIGAMSTSRIINVGGKSASGGLRHSEQGTGLSHLPGPKGPPRKLAPLQSIHSPPPLEPLALSSGRGIPSPFGAQQQPGRPPNPGLW